MCVDEIEQAIESANLGGNIKGSNPNLDVECESGD